MSTIPQLTPTQLAVDSSGARIVDVREPDEVATGRIAGSLNIPLGQLASRLDELDPATTVVTVCQSGGRSQRAAEALAGAGYRVTNLEGGMTAWTSAGQPTV